MSYRAPQIGYEPGYFGALTRHQAEGCHPNGTRVRKIKEDPGGDYTPIGELGTVLGSINHPSIGACYFIEWDRAPKVAVACVNSKIEPVEP